jgi:hypothetical protein
MLKAAVAYILWRCVRHFNERVGVRWVVKSAERWCGVERVERIEVLWRGWSATVLMSVYHYHHDCVTPF